MTAKRVARINDTISHGGEIIEGSPNSRVNSRKVARLGDQVQCDVHGLQTIVSASTTVKANGKGVARLGDLISCGATITSASNNVLAGE